MQIKCAYTKLVPIENLQPHPDNENKHSEEQIKALAKIILKDGMRHPIIVSNLSGYICAGHGRLAALKLLEVKEVPVDFQEFDDSIQELRVRNADNQIARYAEFQRDKFELNLQKYDIKIEHINEEEFGFIIPDYSLAGDSIVEEVNKGDENSNWIGDTEFKEGDGYIKLIYHFKSEEDRLMYVDQNKINIDKKNCNQWIVYK